MGEQPGDRLGCGTGRFGVRAAGSSAGRALVWVSNAGASLLTCVQPCMALSFPWSLLHSGKDLEC